MGARSGPGNREISGEGDFAHNYKMGKRGNQKLRTAGISSITLKQPARDIGNREIATRKLGNRWISRYLAWIEDLCLWKSWIAHGVHIDPRNRDRAEFNYYFKTGHPEIGKFRLTGISPITVHTAAQVIGESRFHMWN